MRPLLIDSAADATLVTAVLLVVVLALWVAGAAKR